MELPPRLALKSGENTEQLTVNNEKSEVRNRCPLTGTVALSLFTVAALLAIISNALLNGEASKHLGIAQIDRPA